ncbi:MAG: UDP-glucuronic acid dehydrogenase [Verrucomicrobia bacterium]|jgi:methionyl-tRNA formyltransferase|nr:UDP-glucuronic acid dehydrogenase [Verrucomicrobiota bacterium]
MKITILCSDEKHPVNAHLLKWMDKHQASHDISLLRQRKELQGGDLLFLISCNEIVKAEDRKKFSKVLVVHASDLPRGRGWSPHIWQIIEGRDYICVSMIEAEDKVDTGDIWRQIEIEIPRGALWDEINEQLFDAECRLMDYAVENFSEVQPISQNSMSEASYYPKRTPADSELDPHKSIGEQFDLIRVCDPERFPAFFKWRGATYTLKIEKQ